jgi:hypothetical protein
MSQEYATFEHFNGLRRLLILSVCHQPRFAKFLAHLVLSHQRERRLPLWAQFFSRQVDAAV